MKKRILKVCAAMACLYAGYMVSSSLQARLAQTIGFQSSPDEGSIKGSGRCIAVANATNAPVELIFRVYSESGGFFKRIGKTKANVDKSVKVKPNDVISFNQKPKLSVFKGGVAGDYQYIEGLTLKVYDAKGQSVKETHVLSAQQVTELNRYIAKVLSDQAACRDSAGDREDYAIIVAGPELSELVKECSSKADELCALSIDGGYSLIIPFAAEKTFFGRAILHGQQHKKTFAEVGKTLKNAAVAGAVIVGSGGSLTGPAIAKFTADTGAQIKGIIEGLPETNLVRQELDSLTGLTGTVDRLKSINQAMELQADLQAQFGTTLEEISSAVLGEEVKALVDEVRNAGKQVLSEASEAIDTLQAVQDKMDKLDDTNLSQEENMAVEAAVAALTATIATKAELEKKEQEIEASEEWELVDHEEGTKDDDNGEIALDDWEGDLEEGSNE